MSKNKTLKKIGLGLHFIYEFEVCYILFTLNKGSECAIVPPHPNSCRGRDKRAVTKLSFAHVTSKTCEVLRGFLAFSKINVLNKNSPLLAKSIFENTLKISLFQLF